MSPATFDLRAEPWIPVPALDGPPRRVGLRDALADAHTLGLPALFAPPATSMLLRVLTAIAYRVTGLGDQGPGVTDWQDRQVAVLAAGRFDPDAVDAYFAAHAGAFGLFDPARPFLQDPRLADESPRTSGINRFAVGRSAGNGPVWYTHHSDDDQVPLPSADAAAHLLVWAGYGPGGANSSRSHTTAAGTTVADHYAKPGPLRGTVSYHPVGRTLFHTLVGGMVPPNTGFDGPVDPAADLCPWEAPLPDPTRQAVAAGPRSLLVGRGQHGLLLTPDADASHAVDARLTWGRKGEIVPARDPYLRHNDEGRPRDADGAVAVWRELDALLGGIAGQDRPFAVAAAQALPAPHVGAMTVVALGFEQDRAQTNDRAWWASATPPVLSYALENNPDAHALVRQALDDARASLKDLRTALYCVGKDVKLKAANPHVLADAERRYWTRSADVFDAYLTAGLDGQPGRRFALAARDAYDAVTDRGAGARQTWAASRNRGRIRVPPAEPAQAPPTVPSATSAAPDQQETA